jgi:diguanylate cyclase (GGDEF)-like protein
LRASAIYNFRNKKAVVSVPETSTSEADPTAAGGLNALGLTQDLDRVQLLATYIYLLAYTIPLAVTGLLALVRGEQLLGCTLAIFALAAAATMWRVYRHGLDLGLRIFCVGAATVLFLFLVVSGGYQGTALFWCFAIFVVIYHFSSAGAGLLVNLTLLVMSAVLLLGPPFTALHPDYGPAMTNRFLVSGTITCMLLFVYAYVQEVLKRRLEATQERLLQVSMTDELTGLTNRRSMKDTLRREDQRAAGERALAIVIADIDHFKRVNDTLGHDAGDQVLVHIANVLRGALRETDRVARWGGEEFLLLLDVADLDEAIAVAERAREAVERHSTTYEGHEVRVTLSFGIEMVEGSAESLQAAIIAADANLLRAKRLGRNRVIAS